MDSHRLRSGPLYPSPSPALLLDSNESTLPFFTISFHEMLVYFPLSNEAPQRHPLSPLTRGCDTFPTDMFSPLSRVSERRLNICIPHTHSATLAPHSRAAQDQLPWSSPKEQRSEGLQPLRTSLGSCMHFHLQSTMLAQEGRD